MSSEMIHEYENSDEEMSVTLTLDEGDVECAIVTILEVNGRDYIVLQPKDENGEPNANGDVWYYRYSENPDDPNEEPELDYIDDDEEYEAVEDRFQEFLDECEFDEMI
ncbi:MAG: DUF1292 domain-containing protein [Lachnospiraceae bacterium]|nr:DUF1292 domain-containing protein [Lachnospiraceae bacterium]